MGSVLTGLLVQIASLIGGGIGGAISTVSTLMNSAFDQLFKFHKEGIGFARDMGMSLNQAQAYTTALTRDTAKLAQQYGITSEAIIKIQKGLSEATSRQLMLNSTQREGFVQLSKLAGDSSVNKFAEEMMNGMGAQIDTVQGAVAKAYASAAKSGLNAKKTTELIAGNLSMANKLSFRNGIDGLTKMAVQAQKIGMSLQSVESVAKTFMDFDSAIEHSAQLQMLGGAAGAFGGNPLDMMYEANYDPEALQGRMTKMLGGYAKFDEKTGMSKINGMGMDFVRNIAKAMGIDEAEAAKIAKKNAELSYKQQKFGGTFSKYSQEQQDAIMNKSYVKDGRLYVNDASGEAHDITNGSIDDKLMKELTQFEGMSDHDIMESQARSLTSIDEKIAGFWESAKALFAEKFADYIPKIQNLISEYGPKLLDEIPAMAEAAKSILTDVENMFNEAKPFFGWLKDGLSTFFGFVREHWKQVLIALLAIKTAKAVSGISSLKGASGKLGFGASKFLKVGSGLVGAGIGAYQAITADNNADRGAGIGTAIGSVAGAAIGGPIGAAIGGWLGGEGGRMIGEHWEEIKDFAKGAWDGIKDFAKGAWEGIKDFALGLIPEDVLKSITDGINAIAPIAKGAWNIIKGYALGAWSAIKGSALGVWEVIKGTALGVWDVVQGAALGVWEVVKGIWNGLWDIISAPFQAIADIADGLSTGFAQIMNGEIIDGILTMFGGVASGLLDIISAPFKALYDVGSGVFKGVGEVIKGVWNGIGEFIKGIWSGIGEFVKGLWNGIMNIWYGFAKVLNKIPGVDIDIPEGHASGGIVGTKDNVVGLATGEIVLSKTMQENLVSILKNPGVYSKPVGNNDFTYKPGRTETSQVGDSIVTVKDFNINLGGTLRLDGSGSSANLNVSELLKDPQFIGQLKDVISDAISSSYNGGRKMNDIATMRGMVAQTTTIGRRG